MSAERFAAHIETDGVVVINVHVPGQGSNHRNGLRSSPASISRRAAAINRNLALLADPEVLLLDEPYAGFDWDTYERFWDLAAGRGAGRSVVVISHFITDQARFDQLVELRDGRTPLLVVVPGVFIAMAVMVTIDESGPIALVEGARHFTASLSERRIHGANLLIALTYAMLGMLLGPLTGRLGGLYLILLLAFIDIGLGQNVMVPSGPPTWGAFLPARGASRVMIDGAFTGRFDQVGYLFLGLAWLAGFSVTTALVFRRRIGATGTVR